MIETISNIADQCDGIRCDMAMLLLNPIFERTWGSRAGQRPATEYWIDVIPAIKKAHPGFLFIAEAYWDMEWELQQQGFDFCYDKKLYDRLEHSNAESVRLHLCADLAYQDKLLRFIENHDEPRAAATFSPARQRVAAVTMATLPGVRLFHEGQFEGRKVRPPVFLGRRPDEPLDQELQSFLQRSPGNHQQPCVSRRSNGACASIAAGRTIQATKTSWPGAGGRVTIDISSSPTTATPPLNPACRYPGKICGGRAGA